MEAYVLMNPILALRRSSQRGKFQIFKSCGSQDIFSSHVVLKISQLNSKY